MLSVMRTIKRMPSRAITRLMVALPDKVAVALFYRYRTGRWPDLKQPTLFTEMIQVQKLTNRDPWLAKLSDKVSAKEPVAAQIGDAWITPTLWTGTDLSLLDPKTLRYPCVLKSSHGSGQTIFLKSAEEDWSKIIPQAHRWLSIPYGDYKREWAYSQVKPALLIEPDIRENDEPPPDYKFFCFHGKVEYVQVDSGRFGHHVRNFFDTDWQHLDMEWGYPKDSIIPEQPLFFAEMLTAAEVLSRSFEFVRVDFYSLSTGPRFGEITFYPKSGAANFSPFKWDAVLGSKWLQPAKH